MANDSVYSTASKDKQDNYLSDTQNPKTSTLQSKKLRPCLTSSGSVEVDTFFEIAGQKNNISPSLLKAVAKVASNFRADATSKAGAMGIMQLMPGTAKYLGIKDPYDAEENIMGGARYLSEQLSRFNGDVKLAIAAYKAGWGAVQMHGGIPPFKDTKAFVLKVLSYMGTEEISAGMLTYDGFNKGSRFNVESDSFKSSFNEALAQMFFFNLIEKQMNAKVSAIFPDNL